jgi:hypothetical protein
MAHVENLCKPYNRGSRSKSQQLWRFFLKFESHNGLSYTVETMSQDGTPFAFSTCVGDQARLDVTMEPFMVSGDRSEAKDENWVFSPDNQGE